MAATKNDLYIGIDLGGTNMQVGVVRADAREIGPTEAILGTDRKKTKAVEGFDAVLDRLVDAVQSTCKQADVALSDIRGVGIGAPGAVDAREGIVIEAVNLRWNDIPLAKILSGRLDDTPVAVDNDVNVAIYGEFVLGAARNARDILGVWIGTGIGGGLILDGKLYYGHHHTAGEIGQMHLFPSNPPGLRTLEEICSRTNVVDRTVKLISSNHKSMLTEISEGRYEKIRSTALAKAWGAGDALTREVVSDAACLLGQHIGSVVTLLSLEMAVIGGGLTEAIGEPFVDLVRQSARATVFPDVCQSVKIVSSELLDNAGLLGAAMIAADRLG